MYAQSNQQIPIQNYQFISMEHQIPTSNPTQIQNEVCKVGCVDDNCHSNSLALANHEGNSTTATTSTTVTTAPTKKRAKRACLNCRSSKVACDQERPCTRCTKHGIEETCLDIPRKPKVVNKRMKKDVNSTPGSSLPPQQATIPTHLINQHQLPNVINPMLSPTLEQQYLFLHQQHQQQLLAQQFNLLPQLPSNTIKKDKNINTPINNNSGRVSPTITNNMPTTTFTNYFGNQDSILTTMTPTITNNGNNIVNNNIPPSPQQFLVSTANLSCYNNSPKSPVIFKFGCDKDDMNTPSPLNYQHPSPPLLNNYLFNNSSSDQIKLVRSSDLNQDLSYFLPSTPQQSSTNINTNSNITNINSTNNINGDKSQQHNHITSVSGPNNNNTQIGTITNNSSPIIQSPSHSIPSSPSSAFSTPVILGSNPDSSPTSPPHSNHELTNIPITTERAKTISLNTEEIQQQIQPNLSSTIQSVFENVFVNLSTLINTSQSFQEPIGMTNSPFGYCIKSPFNTVDGAPTNHHEINNGHATSSSPLSSPVQVNDLSIIPAKSNVQTMIPINQYHNSTQIQSFLPEILVAEFKKIHQSLETITSLLQFPSVQRPIYAPSPKHSLVPGSLWTPCVPESISALLPYSRWKFPNRSLVELNENFCKILGYQSIAQFYEFNPTPNWDDTVHIALLPFTNRYAMEAVIKGIKKFQRPCIFKRINGRYLSVNILIEFDDHYTAFKTTILQKYSEVSEDLSSEYIVREYRGKQACLELDD